MVYQDQGHMSVQLFVVEFKDHTNLIPLLWLLVAILFYVLSYDFFKIGMLITKHIRSTRYNHEYIKIGGVRVQLILYISVF